jgi:hypothetical protein
MDMTCQSFSDLVRINQQVVVAKKYTSMLRESISIQFGQKFKHNFEVLQVLLGILESQLQGTESTIQEKQKVVDQVNHQMAQLFAENPSVLSRPTHSFANFSKVAFIPEGITTAINKGTLLSSGIHQWSVRCVNVVTNYDLGVAAPFANSFGPTTLHQPGFGSGFNSAPPDAWGLRQNGFLFPSRNNNNTPYKTGDILSFVLDCPARSLTISINERQVATIPNVVLPVHIALSGGSQASAEIL